jgi:hypothetical protein
MDVTEIKQEPTTPGHVWRIGKIFELGDYPDKGFSLSEAEADRAIAQFTPVAADLEHKDTILSGKLGTMRRIWRDGRAVFGAAEVPEWLDTLFKSGEREPKVSCAWERTGSKLLKGWGWVLDPHINEAALFSAYAQFTRSQAATAPTAPTPTQPAQTNTRRENVMSLTDKLREMFTASFSAGAADPSQPTTVTTPGANPAPTPQPTAPAPASSPTPTSTPSPVGTPAADPANPTATPEPGSLTAPGNPSVNFSAPGTEQEADERQVEFKAQRIKELAEQMVDRAIADGHLYSAGRAVGLAAFTAALLRDETEGPSVVTFTRADGRVVNSMAGLLTELLAETPKHALFSNMLPVNVYNGSRGSTAEQDDAKKGAEQAAEFNRTLGVKPSPNGNGSHA